MSVANGEAKLYLKEIRMKRGLRQIDVASMLVPPRDQTMIAKWERGEFIPRGKTLLELTRILGCSLDELLGGPRETA